MKNIEKNLEISNQNEAYYLDAESILYVKADGNYCDIHLTDGYVLQSVGFQRAEIARMIDTQLPPYLAHQFALLGRSYLINMERVMHLNVGKQMLTFDANMAGVCKRQSIKASTEALRSLRSLLSGDAEEPEVQAESLEMVKANQPGKGSIRAKRPKVFFNEIICEDTPAPLASACHNSYMEEPSVNNEASVNNKYDTGEDEVMILGE